MVIANPLYDVVFKRMMENDKVAKFFIGTLLNQTIESVQVRPQEFTPTKELVALAVFRLDFVATIKTVEGEFKKVLIKIQKARNYYDLIRFRDYLVKQYKRNETIINKKFILPIIGIYLLDFELPEVETAFFKVMPNYKDLINKGDFIEKLTHDSYIVQATRIKDNYKTRLDKLLSVFEQTNFIDNTKIIKEFNHSTDFEGIEEMKIMTDILHYTGTDPKEKKKIEIEQEAWRTVDAYLGGVKEKYEKTLKNLEEKEKKIAEKEKEISEKDALIAELMKKLNDEK